MAPYPPRLELAELEPQVGPTGGDRERLLEIADRLLERGERPCAGGGADELRDRFQVRTCEPARSVSFSSSSISSMRCRRTDEGTL